MSALTLDLTPMAINRTAMYFIVRDTARHLIELGLPVRLTAMGEALSVAVFVANDYALPQPFEQRVLERLHQMLATGPTPRAQRSVPNPQPGSVFLAFDPLYVFNRGAAARTICFVLDLTPYTRPEWHDRNVSRFYAAAFDALYDRSIDIVSISHSTSRDLWANFGIPRARVTWVPLYDRFGACVEARDSRPVFLFVGSLEFRKNITRLVEGFAQSGLAAEGFALHIVGGDGHGAQAIREHAAGVPGVRFLGRLPDEALRQEYAHCCALAYPSMWEGFGLPALEGLRRGLPMLLADTGALPEVGGACATYADPCSTISIAAGLRTLAEAFRAGRTEPPCDVAAQSAPYDKAAYLQTIVSLVRRHLSPVPGPADTGPAARALRTRAPVSRLGQWVLTHRTRILPVGAADMPADSFSLDYLYGIQQERRVALSRALGRVMTGGVLRVPVNLVYVLIEYVSLRLTTATVAAMINEKVALKLGEAFDDRHG
ncbi:MAG: glycosyltransferase family 1 protein [Rhodocyclaceae bacterium]